SSLQQRSPGRSASRDGRPRSCAPALGPAGRIRMAVPSASQTPVQHRRRRGDDGRDDEGTERETGEHVVDVVDSGGHSRGGDRQRERQREPGEAGDDEDAGGGEGSGQARRRSGGPPQRAGRARGGRSGSRPTSATAPPAAARGGAWARPAPALGRPPRTASVARGRAARAAPAINSAGRGTGAAED